MHYKSSIIFYVELQASLKVSKGCEKVLAGWDCTGEEYDIPL